ncbi:MAG: hypothetical protein ACK56F_11605, partial [bacterium]
MEPNCKGRREYPPHRRDEKMCCVTVDGTSIWAGDGVHLTSNATRVSAMKMMAYVIGGETAEPANKRARLESVIPVRTT